jgi:hypothetical protein
MTLGTREEARKQVLRTETLSYSRDLFPVTWNDHNVILLKNYLFRTSEGRLFVELDLHCTKCTQNCAIRNTIDTPSNEHIRTIKLIPLGFFYTHKCKR